MTAKSIIEIDVRDEAFKKFNEQFDQYKESVKNLPGRWGDQEKMVRMMGGTLLTILRTEKQVSQEHRDRDKLEKDSEKREREREKRWKELRKDSTEFARNVANATVSMAKWITYTAGAGLLGLGAGVWGVNRLASATAGNYRQAQGLGTTTGQAKAFDVNFGRYVDSQSILSSVNEAMHDQSKRWTLLAAGLREDQIQNRDTAAVAADLLPLLKQRFAQGGGTLQGAQAYGLTQFASLEDLIRLQNTSGGELSGQRAQYDQDRKNLELSQQTQKRWQDFNTQLDRAKETIQNVFVDTLTPLIDPFTRLSKAIADALKTALGDPHFKQWLQGAGEGLKEFASYLASPAFRTSVGRFFEVIDVLGTKLYGLLKKFGWVGGSDTTPSPSAGNNNPVVARTGSGSPYGFGGSTSGTLVNSRVDQNSMFAPFLNWLANMVDSGNSAIGGSPSAPSSGSTGGNRHNPGNLRSWGNRPQSGGFAVFDSDQQGLRAMADQLRLYQNRDHLDTLSAIINKWAPPGENNTGAYIKDVSDRTGLGATQRLNLNDPDTLASIMSAMTKHENSRSNFTPKDVGNALGQGQGMYREPVIIQINNNTGGSATVSTSQLAY